MRQGRGGGLAPEHDGRRVWRAEIALLGLFVGVVAVAHAPLLIGYRTFPDGDFSHHFFPFALFQHQALAEWRLPVWNPYTYGGHPFLADVQAAVFYPLSNLILWLTLPVQDAAARLYWLQVEALLHVALGGWFAALWARDLTGSRAAGVVAGLLLALSGYMSGYAPLQLAVLRTAIWLPLLWWCLGRAAQDPARLRWWVGSVGALAAAFLAGHSQTFMLLGYGTAGWVVCLLWAVPKLRGVFLRGAFLLGVGGVGVAVLGVTAAQWLPSWEFVGLSVRAQVAYAFVSGGFPAQDLWQLALPGVLSVYSPIYIGAVGGALALVGLGALLNSTSPTVGGYGLAWRGGAWFCVGLTALALLAALGENGPLYPLLYRAAPGWAWFRGQERAAVLVTYGLVGLAAYGVAGMLHWSLAARRRVALVAGAVMTAAVYAFGVLWQLRGMTAVGNAAYLLIALLTLLLTWATVLLVWLPLRRRVAWVAVLAVANLVWAVATTNHAVGSPADRVRLAPEVAALAAAAEADSGGQLPGRVYNEYRAYADYGMTVGVEDVWGSSPLRVARYAALFEEFPLDRMWRLLGVTHVLTWRRELFGPSTLLGEYPQAADTTYLHRLPDAPRAWLVGQVEVADDAAALGRLADHQVDLDAVAFIAADQGWNVDGTTHAVAGATVQMVAVAPGVRRVEVTTDPEGLLVVAETWLPGWVVEGATCSGGACPAPTAARPWLTPLRVNVTQVGLWIPPGGASFTLRYAPTSVAIGVWVSGLTLAGMALSALVVWVRRRR